MLVYRNENWNNCPNGYFLHGLERGSGDMLGDIKYGRCCKPTRHPDAWGQCYTKDIGESFDKEGWGTCKDDYYIAGLYRGTCNKLFCLEFMKCCKML